MIAVFKTGGKQYCVKAGQILKVEKITGKKGDSLTFNEILMIGDKSENSIGKPLVSNVSINATILDQIKGKKIIVFKKRRRKNSRSKQGHRQCLTVLRIESINKGDIKSTAKKATKEIGSLKKQDKDNQSSKSKKTEKKIIKKSKPRKIIKKKEPIKKNITKKITRSKK